jgi:hypothetical protein
MSSPNQKYQRRTAEIVGASSTVQAQQQQYYVQNSAADKKLETKNNQATSFLGQSEEFKIFWGDHLEAHWFEKKTFISPFIIVLALTSFLTIYLSIRLLFSPGEFEQLFTNVPETTIVNKTILKTRQEDKKLSTNRASFEPSIINEKSLDKNSEQATLMEDVVSADRSRTSVRRHSSR